VDIRNIAIIAHVDHGKTTLVDQLLRQSGTLGDRAAPATRIMDSNDLEKERGITILAKNTAITWQGVRVNVVDTPGHADFGGEVERILSMVDAVLLVVDAVDGPMPQTRFVTQKAFAYGLKPIVAINKVDRPGARPDWAVDQVFDLFVQLGATDDQLDFPIVYASALEGYASLKLGEYGDNMHPLLDLLLKEVPEPKVDVEAPFQMQISALDYSSYVGAIGIGRITRGMAKPNMLLTIIDRDGKTRSGKLMQVLGFMGLERTQVDQAEAGDIIAVTGVEGLRISDTLCAPEGPEALPALTVDEPTVTMTFQVNDSPLAGQEGKYVTARHLKDRLDRELIANVALRVEPGSSPSKFRVSGRGELHLAILIEEMRREGYELALSRPEVVIKEIDGVPSEPFEQLVIDVPSEYQGSVMTYLAEAKAQLEDMTTDNDGRVRMSFMVPTRGLIGFHGYFQTMTSGTGLMYHRFDHYAPCVEGKLAVRRQGVLISNAAGVTTGYALWNLESRGKMILGPQVPIYEGMVIGIHTRANDLVVNVIKGKQLTNVRASGTDENIALTPPVQMTLEAALEFIDDDELVEVTPESIRIRKRFLKEHERKRASRG
jgi:GTP-binding protein